MKRKLKKRVSRLTMQWDQNNGNETCHLHPILHNIVFYINQLDRQLI